MASYGLNPTIDVIPLMWLVLYIVYIPRVRYISENIYLRFYNHQIYTRGLITSNKCNKYGEFNKIQKYSIEFRAMFSYTEG